MDSSGTDGLTLVQEISRKTICSEEVILEFRAGKMFTEGTRVVPDTRRGLVRLIKGEEGLIHLQWLDRSQNIAEDDQIVFPDEAVFEKVEQSSGRVYILKFNTDNRKFFFWMQEPKSDGDARICSLVNYYINRPLDLQEDDAEASVPLQTSELSDDTGNEISSKDANMNTMKASAETADEVSSSGPVQLADLQRILSNFEPAALGLGDILKPDLLQPLIQTLPLDGQLASYLPEGKWTPDSLIELLQSPPFRQQVDSFTYVLQTGQIDLSQFGIDPSKYKFTVTSFLEALEDSVSKNSSSENAANSTPMVASDMQTDVKDPHPHQPNDDTMDESQ